MRPVDRRRTTRSAVENDLVPRRALRAISAGSRCQSSDISVERVHREGCGRTCHQASAELEVRGSAKRGVSAHPDLVYGDPRPRQEQVGADLHAQYLAPSLEVLETPNRNAKSLCPQRHA